MYPSSAVKNLIYMWTTADKIFEHINYQKQATAKIYSWHFYCKLNGTISEQKAATIHIYVKQVTPLQQMLLEREPKLWFLMCSRYNATIP